MNSEASMQIMFMINFKIEKLYTENNKQIVSTSRACSHYKVVNIMNALSFVDIKGLLEKMRL